MPEELATLPFEYLDNLLQIAKYAAELTPSKNSHIKRDIELKIKRAKKSINIQPK